MKVYKYENIEVMNTALAEFDKKRIKVMQIIPHYYEDAPPITNRSAFTGKTCFYVTTTENNTPERFEKNESSLTN